MSETAAAPTPESRLSALADSMIQEADDANPDAWENEQPAEEAPKDGEATQPEEAQPEEPQGQAPELVEIELDGEKYQVPKKVAEGTMKEKDYRQKTMELAEERKGAEAVKAELTNLAQQARTLAEQAQRFAPAFGQVAAIDGQIQNLQRQLTAELRATDPVAFAALGTDLQLLANHRMGLVQHLDQAVRQHQAQLAEVTAKANHQRVQRALPELNKAVPGGFTQEAAKRAHEYLVNSGLSAELNEVMPGALDTLNYLPKAVLTMWKAAEYDRLQANIKTSQKKVENLPPVARPSAKVQSSEQKAKTEKLRDKFRETGGKDSQLSRALIHERLFGS